MSEPVSGDWDGVRRILVVRLDGMGDLLMTGPAIRALHLLAGEEVTVLTSAAGAAVASMLPGVGEVIPYVAPWMKVERAAGPEPDLAMIEALRARHLDAMVIPTVSTQSALPAAMLGHLAGIPRRLAYARERVYGLLTDAVPEMEPLEHARHEVRRQLDLVARVGATVEDERLAVRVSSAAHAEVEALLRARGIDPRAPWLVIHPGASAASRRYPAESFAAVAAGCVARGWQVVVADDEAHSEAVEAMQAAAPVVSVAGLLDVERLAALLAGAAVVIANNSGPMHLAAAVGTPVVCLYALTNPQHTPWGVPHRVLFHDVPCRWCLSSVCPEGHQHCLRLVGPEEVVEAAMALAAPRTDGSRNALIAAER